VVLFSGVGKGLNPYLGENKEKPGIRYWYELLPSNWN